VCRLTFQDVTFQTQAGPHAATLCKGYLYGPDDWDALAVTFARSQFPTDWPVSSYVRWSGHPDTTSYNDAADTYGTNDTSWFNTPSLAALLGEHLVAPFFLLQILCVCLWSLDEYWYYALFTLFTLMLFETTVAVNRRRSLRRLREHASLPLEDVYCYRFGEWNAV